MEAYMSRPTEVLKQYMSSNRMAPTFELGQLSMGLEAVSLIRTLEDLPVVSDAEREGTIATLYTLLRENGLEGAFEAYEALNDWRKVKFTRESSPFARGRERQENASFDALSR